MTPVTPSNNEKGTVIPILPLVPEVIKYRKEDLVIFKCRTDPSKDASMTYTITIPKFHGTESVREAIQLFKQIRKVWVGQGCDTAAKKETVIDQVVLDSALTSYQEGRDNSRATQTVIEIAGLVRDEEEEETEEAFEIRKEEHVAELREQDLLSGLLRIIDFVCPDKGLAKVKRYLRRKCRKPADMKCRVFFNHLTRINKEELTALPPLFNDTQSLGDDELVDIMLFAFPQSWQGEMQRQGFDYTVATPGKLLDFCERLESAEITEGTHNKTTPKKNAKKPPSKSQKTSNNNDGSFFCLHHGKNHTHNTDDCRVVQNMTASIQKGGTKTYASGKNKWSKKAEDAKKQTQKELANYVRKVVRKELSAFDSNKRKAEDDNDDDEEGEINAIDFASFNYQDMSNLKIDSEEDNESNNEDENDDDSDEVSV